MAEISESFKSGTVRSARTRVIQPQWLCTPRAPCNLVDIHPFCEVTCFMATAAPSTNKPGHPGKPYIWTLRHVIDSATLTRPDVHEVLQTAKTFSEILSRPIKKVPTLRGKVVVNMFYENSTRTLTSFELAAKYLSADTVNFSVATSSVKKGESLIDTAETLLAMGVDALVIRHSHSGVCQQLAQAFGNRMALLNAGDGYHD